MPLTNVLAVFNLLKSCQVGGEEMQIEHLSIRQGFVYIKFKSINTRNDAEKYRNKTIKIEKSLLEETKEEDDFLVDDLIGMLLYDDKGEYVGQIVDILNYGATDIFVIEKEERQYEVPYVKDVFVSKGDKLIVDSEKLKEVLIWL